MYRAGQRFEHLTNEYYLGGQDLGNAHRYWWDRSQIESTDMGSRTSKKLGRFLDSWNNSELTKEQYELLYCPGYSGGYRFGNTKLKYRTWSLLEA